MAKNLRLVISLQKMDIGNGCVVQYIFVHTKYKQQKGKDVLTKSCSSINKSSHLTIHAKNDIFLIKYKRFFKVQFHV